MSSNSEFPMTHMHFLVRKKLNYAASVQAIQKKTYLKKARLLKLFTLIRYYCFSSDFKVVASEK